jgi:hypothetical protein
VLSPIPGSNHAEMRISTGTRDKFRVARLGPVAMHGIDGVCFVGGSMID